MWRLYYLHNYFLRRETAVSFNFEIKFIGFGVKIEGFIVSWWFFFLSIITKGPFSADICFVPVGCVAKFIVRIVFKGNGGTRGPFCVFFCDTLYECECVRV